MVDCVRDESNSEDKWFNGAATVASRRHVKVAPLDGGGGAAGSYVSAPNGHYSPWNAGNSQESSIMRLYLFGFFAVVFLL